VAVKPTLNGSVGAQVMSTTWISSTATFAVNSITYGLALVNGRCWIKQNLGATAIPTAFNNVVSTG